MVPYSAVISVREKGKLLQCALRLFAEVRSVGGRGELGDLLRDYLCLRDGPPVAVRAPAVGGGAIRQCRGGRGDLYRGRLLGAEMPSAGVAANVVTYNATFSTASWWRR